jgi:hypothetical protein
MAQSHPTGRRKDLTHRPIRVLGISHLGTPPPPDLATACTYLIDTLPTPASESRTLAESTMLGHRIGHCEVQAELSC